MSNVGGIGASRNPYDPSSDDDELRRKEQEEAKARETVDVDPDDVATLGETVHQQKATQTRDEHAQYLAQNDAPSAHEQLANLGVKLPVDFSTLADAPLDARPGQPAAPLAAFVEKPAIARHAQSAPPAGARPVAPTPVRGVALYSAVEPDLPPSNASAGNPLAIGPYRLHLATSDGVGVYYVAYNVETKRNEYAVGANEQDVATFRGMQSPPPWFPDAASIAWMAAPKSEADALSQRSGQRLLEQRYGDGLRQIGDANVAAWKSPEWWMQNAAALGLGAIAPVAEELSPIADAAPRAAPELRLVVDNATPELRAFEAVVDGNAALDLAPTAARPALTLVPAPVSVEASGAMGLEVQPRAMPWLAPGLFAFNALRPTTALSLGSVPVSTPLGDEPGSDELANGCVGRPLGYHLGGDEVHNTCADNIGNDYPGSDYLVVTPEGATRAFDLARLPEVGEVKTGKLSYYSQELANKTIKDYAKQSELDNAIAKRCGLSFTLYIADPAAAGFFKERLPDTHVELADDPTCKRP